MIYKYFDDLEIGEKTVSERARTITETDVVFFCYFTGNWYELHSNVEYARKTQFGERLVQGSLTFAIAAGLQMVRHDVVMAFYGLDKMRFPAPVKIGDTLRAEAEVVDKEVKGDDRGVVTIKQTIHNQRDETVAIMFWKLLVKRKK